MILDLLALKCLLEPILLDCLSLSKFSLNYLHVFMVFLFKLSSLVSKDSKVVFASFYELLDFVLEYLSKWFKRDHDFDVFFHCLLKLSYVFAISGRQLDSLLLLFISQPLQFLLSSFLIVFKHDIDYWAF